jgi:hypothetical protein
MVLPILVPYRVSRVLAFVGTLEGVVDACDDDEKVRKNRADFVGNYAPAGIFISGLKWIDLRLLVTVLKL